MAATSGKGKKIGRDKIKCELYRKSHKREKRKLKHMLKSNRYADVVKYANEHDLKAPPAPVKLAKPPEYFDQIVE